MKFLSKSPAETKKIAADFAKKLLEVIRAEPVKVGLSGDLGAGKTTFVQGMARGCGIDPEAYVNSPTFTMINEYEGKGFSIVHVDLYRIDKPVEGRTLALEEYFRPGRLIVVEWPENWPELMKELDFEVRLSAISDKTREIEVRDLRNDL